MSKTILLVEDYDDSREMLKVHLEMLGYRVVEATNGYDAVEYVKQELPDLILMDMSMPEIDGLNATRRIRELAETDRIPILCVTAHGDYYNEKAIEAGCREVVAKPVDLESLTGIVERYLKDEKDVEDPQNNFFAAD
jgi:two-component system, cell cycle response regulator DivK